MAATPRRRRLLARGLRRRASSTTATPASTARRAASPSTSRSSAWPRQPTATGYWLVASDGGIFSYGDAAFYGSAGPIQPQPARSSAWPRRPTAAATGSSPPTAASSATATRRSSARPAASRSTRRSSAWPRADGSGYWLVAADGGIFNYGTSFFGSMGGQSNPNPIRGHGRDARRDRLLAPADAPPPPAPPTLSPGASGAAVVQLQQQLLRAGLLGRHHRRLVRRQHASRPCGRCRRRPAFRATVWSGRHVDRAPGRRRPAASRRWRATQIQIDLDERPDHGREQRAPRVDAQHVDRRRLHLHPGRGDVGRQSPRPACSRPSARSTAS